MCCRCGDQRHRRHPGWRPAGPRRRGRRRGGARRDHPFRNARVHDAPPGRRRVPPAVFRGRGRLAGMRAGAAVPRPGHRLCATTRLDVADGAGAYFVEALAPGNRQRRALGVATPADDAATIRRRSPSAPGTEAWTATAPNLAAAASFTECPRRGPDRRSRPAGARPGGRPRRGRALPRAAGPWIGGTRLRPGTWVVRVVAPGAGPARHACRHSRSLSASPATSAATCAPGVAGPGFFPRGETDRGGVRWLERLPQGRLRSSWVASGPTPLRGPRFRVQIGHCGAPAPAEASLPSQNGRSTDGQKTLPSGRHARCLVPWRAHGHNRRIGHTGRDRGHRRHSYQR